MQEGVVSEALGFSQIYGLEELQDLLGVEEADQRLLGALLGDVQDPVGQVALLRVGETQHLGEGLDGGQALIAGPGQVVALFLQCVEKGDDQLGGDMFQAQRRDLDPVVL